MIKKKKKLKVPGEILLKHLQYDTPEVPGLYACYYKPFPPSALSNSFPTAGMKIITFNNGKFFGGEHILAWIGPLPVLSLDELDSNQECLSRVFYTGNLKEAAKNKFRTGPHSQYLFAKLGTGKKNEFIFEVNTHKSIANPVARYNLKSEKWKDLKEKDIKKYIKIMKKFGRK